ncbi:hypothetical protein [Pelagicoccus sp. SDUM812005]|uniref:hypothetical protein n=1 Tax=Pelagicoccus sp. SDUM812005 TaxID=3041257 RepID=UPI0028101BE3|nr:hypothetical protein [Pelagicoccus sp. SDUM812005]MDQ8181108.1 hypothetical protein [Pelagicoccus sp. SDUM812005]
MREETTTTLPHEEDWADSEKQIATADKKSASPGIMEKASTKIHDAKSQAGAAASEFAGKTKQRISESSEAAKQRYVELKEQAALQGTKAKQAVQSSFERHPLAYLAGAVVAGVAIGMALPRSRKEKEALASSGQKLRHAAGEAKRETLHAAEAATEAATDTFQKELGADEEASAGENAKQS